MTYLLGKFERSGNLPERGMRLNKAPSRKGSPGQGSSRLAEEGSCVASAERPSDERERWDIVKLEPFSIPRPGQREANRQRGILGKRLRQRGRGEQPTLRHGRAEQANPFESGGYLLGLFTQARLVCGKARVQIPRVAIEDAGNLR
jgi:hypothetical protein